VADDKGRQSNRKRPSCPHLRTQMVRRLDLDGVWCWRITKSGAYVESGWLSGRGNV